MNKSRIFLVLLSFLGLQLNSTAQYSGDIAPVNPVTPNEAAMFKPVAQPIGSFSGTVPVEIPLIAAGRSNFPIPISLNYNTSGFKVEEYAGSTGLGWNLSVGGSITRILHGLPDDASTVGFIRNPAYKPSQILTYSTYTQLEPPLNDVRIGSLDLQPDEFLFTCNGFSGKFHFDENRNIQIGDASGITIVPVPGGNSAITGWILTDTKGYKYYFGKGIHTSSTAVDQNTVTYSSNNGYNNLPASQVYNADWHLIEIDDMNGFVLAFFNYTLEENFINTRLQAYMKLQTGPTIGCELGESYNGDESFTTLQTLESTLTSITTQTEKIYFYGDYNRVDYSGGYELDSIKETDLSGNLTKLIHFNYDYFHQSYIPSGQDAYYKRLELLSVSEFGTDRTDSLTHRFDYYTTYNLPSRYSRGQDYWGFYNGQDANWTLMPNGTYTFMGVSVSESTLGERRPIFPYSQSNVLTKIHFPTGGTRAFTYEANQYLWDPASTSVPDASYFAHRTIYATTWTTSPPTAPQYQTTFTINSQTGSAVWNFYLSGCCYYGSYSVKVLDQYGHTTFITFGNQLSGNISLQNGTYMMQFFFTNCTINSFNAYWDELSMSTATMVRFGRTLNLDNMTGPGVRMKQVDDYDPVSGQTITTRYQYNLFNDSLHTSGLVITPTCVAIDMSCGSCDYIRLTANSNYPLSQQGSSYVNYTDVRTYQTGNGRTDRRFSFDFDNAQGGGYDQWLGSLEDNSWRRGRLLSTKYYDNSGSLLRKDTTCYSILGNNSSYYLNFPSYPDTTGSSSFRQTYVLGYKVHAWQDGVSPGTLDYCYQPTYLTSQYALPDSTVSYIYSPTGTQVEKTAYAYYDSLKHPLVQQETHYLNNNTNLLKNYRYAFSAGSSFILPLGSPDLHMKDTLLGFNNLQPLEITSRKIQGATTSFVEGTHYSYGSFYVFPKTYYYPALSRHYTSLVDSIDMNYAAYDSLGNLTEFYKTGDPHTVWLWGYNWTLPVAKVTGSTFAAVKALVNNNILQNPSSDNDILTQVGNVRSSFSGLVAQVTTYAYRPIFGMSSQVDVAGRITTFEYDSHGRLITIRDQNKNIVKKFTYKINNP